MSNIIPKDKGERYTAILALIFISFILFRILGADERAKMKGIDEFNDSISQLSENSRFFLFKESSDVYDDKWYKSGNLGGNLYNCFKNSTARLGRLPSDYHDIYLRISDGNSRSYFVLNVDAAGKTPYATFTEYVDGEYGFRSIRNIVLDCKLELTKFN